MYSELTNILDMSAAARVQRRHAQQRVDAIQHEQRAIAKLLHEGWVITYDAAGNWSAHKESN